MTDIKVVIFDIDGVVNDYGARSYRMFLAEKSAKSFEEVSRIVDPLIDELIVNRISLSTFESEIGIKLGIGIQDVGWLDYYRKAKPNKSVLDLVSELKKKGYSVGYMTNTDSSRYGMTKAFTQGTGDFIFAACKMGVSKPKAAAFKFVLDSLNRSTGNRLEYKNFLFIDDSVANVEAATSLGMAGIVFRDISQLKYAIEEKLS